MLATRSATCWTDRQIDRQTDRQTDIFYCRFVFLAPELVKWHQNFSIPWQTDIANYIGGYYHDMVSIVFLKLFKPLFVEISKHSKVRSFNYFCWVWMIWDQKWCGCTDFIKLKLGTKWKIPWHNTNFFSKTFYSFILGNCEAFYSKDFLLFLLSLNDRRPKAMWKYGFHAIKIRG